MREQTGINANTFKRRASLPQEEIAYLTTRSRYTAPAAHSYVEMDEEGQDVYTRPQTRTSARRYDLAPYRHGRGEQRTEELPRQGKHPLFYIGICLGIMVVFLTAYTLRTITAPLKCSKSPPIQARRTSRACISLSG